MKKILVILSLLAIISIGVMPVLAAEAARGGPGSLQFGFGGCIYPDGQYRTEALYMAQNLNLDWVQIDVSWKEIWPDPSQAANWAQMDEMMNFFKGKSIAVMLSITEAPAWALSETGPDVGILNAFLGQMTTRYPASIHAIELFPGANTTAGWGAQPNPAAYLNLFTTVKNSLQQSNSTILLVAAGLTPVQPGSQAGDINDLQFLQSLYDAGARDQISVFSLNYSNLTGDPTLPPSLDEPQLLRHYEDIRHVMISNQNDSGILWINHLRLPTTYSGSSAGAWITQAYGQLRSQLYVGVVFYDSLNPPNPNKHSANPNSLLLTDGQYNSHYQIFSNMVLQNSNGSLANPPGRPKSEPLNKGNK